MSDDRVARITRTWTHYMAGACRIFYITYDHARCEHLRVALLIELAILLTLFADCNSTQQTSAKKKPHPLDETLSLAGACRIELQSKVLETFILTVVLRPYVTQ